MNVLVLHSNLGELRGGGENFSRNLFTAFAKRGHRITAAFATDRRGKYPIPLPPDLEPLPIPIWGPRKFGQATLSAIGQRFFSTNTLRNKWHRVQDAVSWRNTRWQKARFQRTVERKFDRRWGDFDAVYVHGNVPLASAAAQRRPTVLRLPGPVTSELEPLLRSVPAVCANGDCLQRIRAFLGDYAIELPIGINAALFTSGPSSVRSTLGWAEQDYVVGFTGRMAHFSGVELLAAAFHEFARAVPAAKLIMIGDGEEIPNMRSALRAEISSNKVHLEPGVGHEQLSQWYRAMDIFVQPSRYANFSNSILEALACGLPFIGSDGGGNKTLASYGAARLFEPGSVSSLVQTLEKACNERAELRTRGRAASSEVRTRYDWAKSAEVLESIFTSRLGLRL